VFNRNKRVVVDGVQKAAAHILELLNLLCFFQLLFLDVSHLLRLLKLHDLVCELLILLLKILKLFLRQLLLVLRICILVNKCQEVSRT